MTDTVRVPKTEQTLEDAITYRIADELIASQYVNGPDASVVLALAHECYLKIADLLSATPSAEPTLAQSVGGEKCCGDFDTLVDAPECRECPARLHWLGTTAATQIMAASPAAATVPVVGELVERLLNNLLVAFYYLFEDSEEVAPLTYKFEGDQWDKLAAAIEAIEADLPDRPGYVCSYPDKIKYAIEQRAAAALEQLAGEGWIDVRDRLPKRHELVLVCAKDVGTVHCLMQYSEPKWFIGQTDASYDNPITYWRPLPPAHPSRTGGGE